MVYLVGAGPGDAGLLTLRGAELLARADVVVYDGLVNPDLLRLAPKTAEVVASGKCTGADALTRDGLSALVVTRARAGRCVVRLQGGDPYIFSPGGEEALALAAAKVPFEVVPGVSSAMAAPSYAGIPVTHLERRPLFGQRIVVTRARDQAAELTRRLRDVGADVLEVPTIKTVPPTQLQELSDAILGLNAYDWLVFTSPNGVSWFFNYFFKGFDDLRDIGGVRLAAVGPATAAKLRDLHLKVDVIPEEYVAAKIVKALTDYESVENLRICLLRAETANPELPKALEALGAIVDDIACYRTVPETDDAAGAWATLLQEGADWITFTSGSTVESFHARFNLPELLRKFGRMRTASLGPETSKALAALGVRPALEAKMHTLDGLVNALVQSAGNPAITSS